MLKVLYAGSPKPSAATLQLLIKNSPNANYKIVGVLTNSPKPQKSHSTPISTEVAKVAASYGLPLIEVEHLDEVARQKVAALSADILVCFSYGRIFGQKFLNLFRLGGINLHPSALPQYRGPTPTINAILNMDEKTCFCVQKITLAMDEGNILKKVDFSLDDNITNDGLLEKASAIGAALLVEVLTEIAKTDTVPDGLIQSGKASYTKYVTKESAKLSFFKSAKEVNAFVRAYYSNPVAWVKCGDDVIRIISGKVANENEGDGKDAGKVLGYIKGCGILVQCQKGQYLISRLQKQGKKEMDAASFINGARGFVGSVLQ